VVDKLELLCVGRLLNGVAHEVLECGLAVWVPLCDATGLSAVAYRVWTKSALGLQIGNDPHRLGTGPALAHEIVDPLARGVWLLLSGCHDRSSSFYRRARLHIRE
jgi:hypothetical protein